VARVESSCEYMAHLSGGDCKGDRWCVFVNRWSQTLLTILGFGGEGLGALHLDSRSREVRNPDEVRSPLGIQTFAECIRVWQFGFRRL
jgi:hypothetical protein